MEYWYFEVFKTLATNNVKYVVVGGIAINLLGIPRFTADLDIVVALDKKNVINFIKCMSLLGYRPKAPVNPKDFADLKIRQEWIKTKNITVFSFWRPDKPYQIVDVFIKEPIPFEKMWGKREKIKLQNLTVPVISIKDLKKLKKTANRAQDISDLKALDELNKELHHEQKTHKRG